MQWEPFHESHSIELAAAAVNFAEPLTEVVWRKAVREAEAVAKAAGLSEKSAMNSVQFTIGPGAPTTTPAAVEAMNFVRSAAIETPVGIQKAAVETLSVARAGLTYQSAAYTRWEAFNERIQMLLRSPLRSALYAVSTANLRLEYRDSFRFRGEGAPRADGLLNRESSLISPHVFETTELWHSHTGFFEKADGSDRLVQINIDSNLSARLGEKEPFRTVSITTAVQNNLNPPTPEALDNDSDQAILQLRMFDSLHARSIDLFTQIVTNEAAARVGIK